MSINIKHFYDFVITPACLRLSSARPAIDSPVARKLVLFTFCQESLAGMYLRQVVPGGSYGVGRGVFMCEPNTHEWIWKELSRQENNTLRESVLGELPRNAVYPYNDQLMSNLIYAAMICRLRYWFVRAALPENNLEAIANYWGKYYQTDDQDLSKLGAKEIQFIENVKRLAPEFVK